LSQSESTYRASIGLLVVLISLSAFGSKRVYELLADKKKASTTQTAKSSLLEPVKYRAAIPPSRVASKAEYPKFRRSMLGNYHVVDLSDSRHVIVSRPNESAKKVDFFYGHIDEATHLEHLEPLPDPVPGFYYMLSVDGRPVQQEIPITTIRRRNVSAVPFVNPFSFGGQYGSFRPIHTVLADGSRIKLQHTTIPNEGANFSIARESSDGKSRSLYKSKLDLVLFFVEGDGTVWFQEGLATRKSGDVMIGRIAEGKVEKFALPESVQFGLNITVSGTKVALSGATSRKGEPNRAYYRDISTSEGWNELPLDFGFDFSVARATSEDGWVFGSQENIREGVTQPVAWKDGALIHLNDIPAWPQTGNSTYIVTSNRRGDLYLRSVLDSSTGQSEYYLLIRQ
jgi:hypothetical protein